ncbi:MAG TPA: urea ABC transporter permease subunit UrtB [Chloroflexota bacterium]|nr:urea ABC transporter permease subunit UrtB [Chloroflexota bacterium]
MTGLVLSGIFNGLSVASILLLVAIGLAITFGLMNVINMAHGQFIMVGAYVAYVCGNLAARLWGTANGGNAFLLALPASFLVTAALGWLLERSLIRFLYKRPLDTLLATWGVGLLFEQAAKSIFGAPNVNVNVPSWLGGSVQVGADLTLSYARLFILALAILALAGVYVYLFRTGTGRLVRAVMQNRAMADCLGVRTDRVDACTFAIGTGLAGLAGAALCLLGPVGPFIGTDYIVQAFMVVVLGGVGQLLGTVGAAATIGGLDSIFNLKFSVSIGQVVVFAAVIAFLQLRPSGFVRTRAR